ncbi:MAG: oleate hydratase [Gammaproteobacteria bacterium]
MDGAGSPDKRYLLRFIQLFPDFHKMGNVWRTPYNQYDSMILPLMAWLKAQGVQFSLSTEVTGLDFDLGGEHRAVKGIRYSSNGEPDSIAVAPVDLVFVTLGCMTENSSLGSMTEPAILNSNKSSGAWSLWEDIANGRPGFGRPAVFADHSDQTKWQSFTVTLKPLRAFFKKTVFCEPPSLFGNFREFLEKSPIIVVFPVNNIIRFFFLMSFLLGLMIFLQSKSLPFFTQKQSYQNMRHQA